MLMRTIAFLSSSILQIATITWCTFLWPSVLTPKGTSHAFENSHYVDGRNGALGNHKAFSHAIWVFGNSNIDIFTATVINLFGLGVALLVASGVVQTWLPRQCIVIGVSRKKASTVCIGYVSFLYQIYLQSKAVAVAVLSEDIFFPLDSKCPGVVLIYIAIVTGLITSLVQSATGKSIAKSLCSREGWPGPSFDRNYALEDVDESILEPFVQKDNCRDSEHNLQTDAGWKKNTTIMALLRLAAVDTPILVFAFAAGIIAALGQALIPYFTGKIVDYASIDPNPSAFRITTLKLLGVAAGCALFTGIRGGLFTIAMTRMNVRLREQLFDSLLRQDIGFFDTTKTGDITSRLSADTTSVSDSVCLNLNIMLRSATQAAMVLGFMFIASWRLTVVTFIMVPLVLAICKTYGSYYRRLSKKVQAQLAEANAVAEEALGTMTTVKAHAAEGSVMNSYSHKLFKFYSLQLKEALAYAAYMATNTFLSAAVVAIVLWYGGSLVLSKRMSSGALVSFLLYQQSLTAAFQALGDVFSALSAAVGAADKVVELMQRQPAFSLGGNLVPDEFFGRIDIQDVHFSYPARPNARVLHGFSLTIEPGEVVALVGASGGGKSSIVKLVERFYLPSEGAIRIDGRPVDTYHNGWLRRRIALVSQEPVLYARSIKRNILFGLEAEDGVPCDEVPSDADVERAARLANAHDFITALPDGYDTECGERGVQLSGGQKQRIAIARALVRSPSILLLDEATSALDADSEALVQEALNRTMAGRTVLLIAHRLSTVQNASKIVVIQHGEVSEVGTHDDLLERGGSYATLVKRQLTRSTSVASLGTTHLGSSTHLYSET